jgi:hypothetical protein
MDLQHNSIEKKEATISLSNSRAIKSSEQSTAVGLDKERVCAISKASVLKGDTSAIDAIVIQVVEDLRKEHDLHLWDISISSYDSDKRHLAEIPEVRDWCINVYAKRPYLPFMMTDPAWYLLCMLGVTSIGKESADNKTLFTIDSSALAKFFPEVIVRLGQFTKEYQLSAEELDIIAGKGCMPVATILHDWVNA